ncbi:Histone acetyltransferase [Kluyveromyces marxianus]
MGSTPEKRRRSEAVEEVYGILDKRNIQYVQFGLNKRFSTWYGSNVYFGKDKRTLGFKELNEEGSLPGSQNGHIGQNETDNSEYWLETLYVCEYCFRYTDIEQELVMHEKCCTYKNHPPGKIYYRSPQYTILRVKGSKHENFCQCLCLFTKLFLDNKSVYFKVKQFEFYIVYATSSTVPMAFFSKDLYSYQENNLACILVFPPYQRKKLGTLLIEFSYLLSRRQNIISGPELPLSPFGLIGYLKFWSFSIVWQLTEGELRDAAYITIREISEVTGFRIRDVIQALKYLKCLRGDEINLNVIRSWARSNKVSQGFMIENEYVLFDD